MKWKKYYKTIIKALITKSPKIWNTEKCIEYMKWNNTIKQPLKI